MLVQKASLHCDFNDNIEKIKIHFTQKCIQTLLKTCRQVGAESLYKTLFDSMSSERVSDERKSLTKMRVMVVIYIMLFSMSQKANWFQVALSRTPQQFGVAEQGLASLRNLGIAVHPRTVKVATQLSACNNLDNLTLFFQSVV